MITTDRTTRFYDECYPYFNIGWRSHKNLCLHYGYHDNGREHDKALIRMIEVLAERAQVTGRDRVLDAGCGIGGSSIWLAQNTGCRVVGIDINPTFINIAKKEAKRRRLDDLTSFYRMDFCHPDLEDSSFDIAWALESSCYAGDKPGFLREMSRLLKPGGRLVVADGYKTPEDSPDGALMGWAVPDIPTTAQFAEYLSKAGFSRIACEDISDKVRPSSLQIYRIARLTYPVAVLLKLLGLKTNITVDFARLALKQYEYGASGLGQYCIFAAVKT